MNKDTIESAVTILGRIYYVKCPPNEVEQLKKAALYLENKLRTYAESTQVLGLERIAVIAALNITHELLLNQQEKNHSSQTVHQKLHDLQRTVDEALAHHGQLELHTS